MNTPHPTPGTYRSVASSCYTTDQLVSLLVDSIVAAMLKHALSLFERQGVHEPRLSFTFG